MSCIKNFCNYAERRSQALEESGRKTTSAKYTQMVNRWKSDGMKDVPMNKIDANMLECWIGKMRTSGLAANTIDFYFRTARAVYNKALHEGMFEPKCNPFTYVHTRPEQTVKRALSLKQLKAMLALDLKGSVAKARDIFMLSFYLRGMPPIDMRKARKKDVCNGVLKYRRSKTNQTLLVRIEKEAAALINKYSADSDSPKLLNIPSTCIITHNLHKVGTQLKLPYNLTLYCARHTWATLARFKDVPLSVISAGLGHNNEQTTMIYLRSIESDRIDKWNRKLIDSIEK